MHPNYRINMAVFPNANPHKPIGMVTLMLLLAGCGSTDSSPQSLEPVTNSIGMPFLIVPPGTFRMGSNSGSANERPVHEVTISKPFALGVTEVTEQQYT
ncbi:MAG TPA: hypothetical protein DEF45_18470, partial [Rhodopirellula sp.]|nr:hypothetical protein [Rhodopirellula sp.]